MAGQTELVLNAILDSIDRGRLNPGDFVEEAAMMAAHGVSRTPVREALIQLETSGLIRRLPRKGAVLFKPTLQEFLSILEVNTRLEGQAAGLAARRLSQANAAQLEASVAACEAHEAEFGGSDPDGYSRLNNRFHEVVALSCGNPFLSDLITTNGRKVVAYYRASFRYPGEIAKSTAEHRSLVTLIVDRRAEEAEELMNRHLGFDQAMAMDLLATLG